MRWVWDANRNNPVHENATLTFGEDGNLVLAEADGKIAWQTNTANKGVTGLQLLPNGNLVLHDKRGKFIWQSFDYPSDTLLVGQSVRMNGIRKLVSRTSDSDGSDGKYSIVLDKNGFLIYLNNSGQPLVYGGWRGLRNPSIVTFVAVPENENATAYELALAYLDDTATPPPGPGRRRLFQQRPVRDFQLYLNKLNYNATLSYLRLGSDGNLRVYTCSDETSYFKWAETFVFFSNNFVRECALPTKCGSYGLCTRGMCVACPTPKGLLGWSMDCAPPKLPPCMGGGGGNNVDYYKVVGVEHFMSSYLDDGEGPMKVGECRKRCDRDCKCAGFVYKEDTSKCLLAPVLGALIADVNTSVGYIKYSSK